eukprot:TRINITY_DN13078_c0_g1_i1.p1 TRINITY_DN13078_c0_g1~~TRINITY_DN13078_c0_g1_i1.p1  ORF type:complete len:133 (-),score=16.34 TRINITY_DN13078_c0_g1_i1:378-749(-)
MAASEPATAAHAAEELVPLGKRIRQRSPLRTVFELCLAVLLVVLVSASLAGCAFNGDEIDETGEVVFSFNPACWINWKEMVDDGNGGTAEQDACSSGLILIVNVVFFYTVFWLSVKLLVLQTQ